MQVAVQLDAAQLAGVRVTLAEYQRAQRELELVIASIFERVKISGATGWQLSPNESALIVTMPDPSAPPHEHDDSPPAAPENEKTP